MGLFVKDKEEYEEYEQEQPKLQGQGTPYYQPMIMPSEKSDLYDKIRPEDVVEMMTYYLMGYRFNPQKQVWEYDPKLESISLSYVGASRIAVAWYSVSNKSTSISKVDENYIRERTKIMVRNIMKDCLYFWHEFGIKSDTTFFYIKDLSVSIISLILKQPEGAGVRGLLMGVSQEVKNINETPKKEGIVGAIFRR